MWIAFSHPLRQAEPCFPLPRQTMHCAPSINHWLGVCRKDHISGKPPAGQRLLSHRADTGHGEPLSLSNTTAKLIITAAIHRVLVDMVAHTTIGQQRGSIQGNTPLPPPPMVRRQRRLLPGRGGWGRGRLLLSSYTHTHFDPGYRRN
jgi:hypothetical protein